MLPPAWHALPSPLQDCCRLAYRRGSPAVLASGNRLPGSPPCAASRADAALGRETCTLPEPIPAAARRPVLPARAGEGEPPRRLPRRTCNSRGRGSTAGNADTAPPLSS